VEVFWLEGPDPAPSPSYPLLDTVLAGRYRLEAGLGCGAVGDVYRAVDIALGRTVAVKVIRAAAGLPLAEQRRFEQEGRTLAGLHHAHLVALYDAGVDDQRAYLVLQYVDGVTLGDRLRDGPLPAAEVARIGAALAAALSHVHAHKIMHRDVKPSNVLLARDGGVFLTDFGIARMVDAPAITSTGMLVGTAAYLAPEQVAGQRVLPASDVYALGLVLLECLTGQRVYQGSVAEVAMARLANPPQVPGDLGPEWRALLTAMTAQDPDNRPNARVVAGQFGRLALVGLVDAALGSDSPASGPAVSGPAPAGPAPPGPAAPGPTAPIPATSPRPSTSRTGRRRLVAIVGCGALLAAGATLALTGGSPPGRTPWRDQVPASHHPSPGGPAGRHGGADAGPGGGATGDRTANGSTSTQPRSTVPDTTGQPTPPPGGTAPPVPTSPRPPSSAPAGTPSAGPTTPGGGPGPGKHKKKHKKKRTEDPLVPVPSLPPVLP
jgi:hypothetical protein